ncbi:MAG: branched-chain amino acid transport system permease protein [Candidatus Poriferisodalaceae bacterium]|jgi:branched-chain amino acid transport system permease protein
MFPNKARDIGFPIVGAVILFSVFVIGALLYQGALGGSAERLVTIMLIDAIIVIGIQIYIGNTGVLSFGHIGFGAIAGYTFAIFAISPAEKMKRIPDAPFGLTDVDMSSWSALLIAIAVTLAVATLVGIGLARSGAESGAVAATVITLALLFVTHEVARNWPAMTGGDRGGLSFRIGGALDTRAPIFVALLAAIVIARLYAQSRSGRLAVAAREDNLAARAMGVNPLVQQMIALLLSVVVVSVGASLRVYETGSILPDNFFFNYSLLTLVMLIVGGRNSVTGALLGVAVMTAGRELARRLGQDGFEIFGIGLDGDPLDWVFRENLQTVVLGLSMLGFMIWRPLGILNDWELDEWLHRRFRRADEVAPAPLPELESVESATLSAADINVFFGGFQALDGARIEAQAGQIVGIIGPNGAGKTTFVNVITGMVKPTDGTFSLSGVDLTERLPFELARTGIVRTFQNLRLFPALTVRENVEVSALIAAEHRTDQPRHDVDALIAEAGLWEHRERRASELDYGNSRRLELARAAALAPQFLLLDEPTSGMSDSESDDMIEQVRHMAATIGAGVIVIDHDLNFINGISDVIYAFDQGRVIAVGTPEEVSANPAVRAAYLGTGVGD